MRVLLDECVDENLRHHLGDHECQTCRYAGLAGLSNGALLAAAERAEFAVVITVDQGMPVQQNLRGRSISIVVLRARTTNLDDLLTLIPRLLEALETLSAGDVVVIAAR
jgi:predicted nuclease of predicted toxin-antitoxin system